MPKHVRHRLISDLRKVCDSLEEYTLFEDTSHEEKQELISVKEIMDKIRVQIWNMSLEIEKRTTEEVHVIPHAPQPKSMFTWVEHEIKAKESGKFKLLSKIERMKQQLENLKAKEEEGQNQMQLPIENSKTFDVKYDTMIDPVNPHILRKTKKD